MEMQRTALVTGAAAGLGRALAVRLAKSGSRVIALDRDEEGLTSLVDETGAHPVLLDLSRADELEAALPELAALGPYESVFLNAGISATGKFEAIPPEIHERVIAVNAVAPMILASGLARHGAFAKPANLVFISSLSHFTGYPGAASYAASKDAIAVYARSIAKPFAVKGIKTMCVFPGPVRTEHAARHAPAGADAARRMSPDELARRILLAGASRRRVLYPGSAAFVAAFAGRVAPGRMTALMRRVIFEKLDREVW